MSDATSELDRLVSRFLDRIAALSPAEWGRLQAIAERQLAGDPVARWRRASRVAASVPWPSARLRGAASGSSDAAGAAEEPGVGGATAPRGTVVRRDELDVVGEAALAALTFGVELAGDLVRTLAGRRPLRLATWRPRVEPHMPTSPHVSRYLDAATQLAGLVRRRPGELEAAWQLLLTALGGIFAARHPDRPDAVDPAGIPPLYAPIDAVIPWAGLRDAGQGAASPVG